MGWISHPQGPRSWFDPDSCWHWASNISSRLGGHWRFLARGHIVTWPSDRFEKLGRKRLAWIFKGWHASNSPVSRRVVSKRACISNIGANIFLFILVVEQLIPFIFSCCMCLCWIVYTVNYMCRCVEESSITCRYMTSQVTKVGKEDIWTETIGDITTHPFLGNQGLKLLEQCC